MLRNTITTSISYFPKPNIELKKTKHLKDKIELGRYLFYDPILSENNSISCASCHTSYNSFAHTDHALSHGIYDSIGNRNAPALINLAWQKSFMWDGAIHRLDAQAMAPINHPKELGSIMQSVIQRLRSSTFYRAQFYLAYQDSSIYTAQILEALMSFQCTLISANAKYDSVIRHETIFTEQENRGYLIFKKHCNTCHTEPLFSNYTFANNGLPEDKLLHDIGRARVTGLTNDSFQFKIPTLRNWSYTYPYMHDGRFKNMKAVLNHYTSEIQKSKFLSAPLLNEIMLNSNEKVDLTAFLLTLNDKEFVLNKKFRFPEVLLNHLKKM